MHTSKLPFGRTLQCNASSMSVHPGGSTLHIVTSLRSFLLLISSSLQNM